MHVMQKCNACGLHLGHASIHRALKSMLNQYKERDRPPASSLKAALRCPVDEKFTVHAGLALPINFSAFAVIEQANLANRPDACIQSPG